MVFGNRGGETSLAKAGLGRHWNLSAPCYGTCAASDALSFILGPILGVGAIPVLAVPQHTTKGKMAEALSPEHPPAFACKCEERSP